MVKLEWPRRSTYVDHERRTEYVGPGEFDVPDEAVEDYLERGWRQVAEDTKDDVDESETDESDEAEESDVELYAEEELREMEWSDLRSLAADSDHDDIDGRSSKDDIIEALSE